MNLEEAGAAREILVFTLGDESYGIDILKVQEIRGYDTVTRIAQAPPHIKGVINLRGAIVPIVDMRLKFTLGEPVYDQFTVVIVLNIGRRVVGIVVDGVSDVLQITPNQLRPKPDFGVSVKTDYILGLAAVDDRMIILVEIDKLMTSEELAVFDQEAVAA